MMGMQAEPTRLFYDFSLTIMFPVITCCGTLITSWTSTRSA